MEKVDIELASMDLNSDSLSSDDSLPEGISPTDIEEDDSKKFFGPGKKYYVGTYGLPLELWQLIFEPLLKAPFTLDETNFSAWERRSNLTKLRLCNACFQKICPQLFYQMNHFCVQLSVKPDADIILQCSLDEKALALRYPKKSVNRYIKLLDFREPDFSSFTSRETEAIKSHTDYKKEKWRILQDVAMGDYGFRNVKSIRVFFPPEPYQMTCLAPRWIIKVRVGNSTLQYGPEDAASERFWEQELEHALKTTPTVAQLDAPGFELIRPEYKSMCTRG